ncbi:hypothetical protein GE09DRAFT_591233 [Coniochaeta sp. 2T2.1]|nr:hypothetical protein GE09DRAFT_591233 [Coniochaeta sp. 2T2.1]
MRIRIYSTGLLNLVRQQCEALPTGGNIRPYVYTLVKPTLNNQLSILLRLPIISILIRGILGALRRWPSALALDNCTLLVEWVFNSRVNFHEPRMNRRPGSPQTTSQLPVSYVSFFCTDDGDAAATDLKVHGAGCCHISSDGGEVSELHKSLSFATCDDVDAADHQVHSIEILLCPSDHPHQPAIPHASIRFVKAISHPIPQDQSSSESPWFNHMCRRFIVQKSSSPLWRDGCFRQQPAPQTCICTHRPLSLG